MIPFWMEAVIQALLPPALIWDLKMLLTNCSLEVKEEWSIRREGTLDGAIPLWVLHPSSVGMGIKARAGHLYRR